MATVQLPAVARLPVPAPPVKMLSAMLMIQTLILFSHAWRFLQPPQGLCVSTPVSRFTALATSGRFRKSASLSPKPA